MYQANSSHTLSVGVAIPLFKEKDCIESLLKCLSNQIVKPSLVAFCINQPELPANCLVLDKNNDPDYLNNLNTEFIIRETKTPFQTLIADNYSPGKRWDRKLHGAGLARKSAINLLLQQSNPPDILIFMDADTFYPQNYIQSVVQNFSEKPSIDAIAAPYYHDLNNHDPINRAILRYEIYLRWIAINSLRQSLPFSFTAFGSTISCRTSSYLKFGGMSNNQAGEDFYFLQKVVKKGILATWNPIAVSPSTRLSNRVIFGTGPALASGAHKISEQYPLFNPGSFIELNSIYNFLGNLDQRSNQLLQQESWPEPLSLLLLILNKEKIVDIVTQIINTKRPKQLLVKEKIDGLKSLQYLKTREGFHNNTNDLYRSYETINPLPKSLQKVKNQFMSVSTNDLNRIRNILYYLELKLRFKEWQTL